LERLKSAIRVNRRSFLHLMLGSNVLDLNVQNCMLLELIWHLV